MAEESPRLKILSDLLRTAQRDFDAEVKTASSIEDKAQKTGAVVGVFVAAGFGFLRPETSSKLKEFYGILPIVLLLVGIVLFCLALGMCLFTVWHRKYPVVGFTLQAHMRAALQVLPLPDEALDDVIMATYRRHQLG